MSPDRLDAVVERVLGGYALSEVGIHGPRHWARVLENGTRLAEANGADLEIVQLFAVLHDSCRINEGFDDGHGARAAAFAESLRGDLITLDDERFELLRFACAHHTDPVTEGPLEVRTCWDSDRLDLGRVRITPDAEYLCTSIGKKPETIRWAHDRARLGYVSPLADRWLNGRGMEGMDW